MFETIDNEDVQLNVDPVAKATREDLAEHPPLHTENYAGFKEDFLKWMLRTGKSPAKGNGYAEHTVRQTHYRIEYAFRWKWNRDGMTTDFTAEDADTYINFLSKRTKRSESEVAKFQKAIKRLFKYYKHSKGRDYEWEPEHRSDKSGESMSHNYFKKHELSRLYNAAIEISSFKSYNNNNMTSEERERLKIHLSQRLGKSKSEIGEQDFREANSWKIPSIVSLCCDAGLRPIEVERSTVNWINFHDSELVIPYNESSKGDEMWEIVISTKTMRALENWMKERESLEKYDNTDSIWLTKYENPYGAQSLGGLLDRLVDEAGIEERNRNLTWYSIRRGVATLWANEEGIHNAKEQLRHKDIETTERYVNSGVAERGKMADSKW